MTDVTTLLAGIKTRAEHATEGPWSDLDAQIRHTQIDGWVDPKGRAEAQRQTAADIDFVKNARTDVPRLVAAIEAVAKVHDSTDAVMYSGSRQYMVKVCAGCGTNDGNWQRYPCPTITAVVAALGGGE